MPGHLGEESSGCDSLTFVDVLQGRTQTLHNGGQPGTSAFGHRPASTTDTDMDPLCGTEVHFKHVPVLHVLHEFMAVSQTAYVKLQNGSVWIHGHCSTFSGSDKWGVINSRGLRCKM